MAQYTRALQNLVAIEPREEQHISFGVLLYWRTHQLNPASYRQYIDANTATILRVAEERKSSSLKAPLRDELSLSPPQYQPESICDCWTCEAIQSALNTSKPSVSRLTAEQEQEIKQDVGFHIAVEKARSANKPIPMRHRKEAKDEGEVWEEDFGLYYYEHVIPAKYDDKGRLIKKEERKKMRMGAGGYTKGFNWIIAGT